VPNRCSVARHAHGNDWAHIQANDDPFRLRLPRSYVSAEFSWMKGSAKHSAAGVGKHSLPIDSGQGTSLGAPRQRQA
jgi:hypothetical protein